MHYKVEFRLCRIESASEGDPADQVAVDVYEMSADGPPGRFVDSCGPWLTVDEAKAAMNAWAAGKGHTLTFVAEP